MRLGTITTRVSIVRMREPYEIDDGMDEGPVAFEAAESEIYTTQYGVRIDHEDGRGHTLIPWHRVLRLETRKFAE